VTDPWEQDLTAAFTVLLGRPADSFDPEAEYSLYYVVNGAIRADWIWGTLDADSLRRTCGPDDGGRHKLLDICLDADWSLDLAQSAFEFDFTAESALSRALGARVVPNRWDTRRVTGDELATIFTEHGLGPSDVVSGLEDDTVDVAVYWRVVTDGTLRDTVLTAIRGKQGPDRMRLSDAESAILGLAFELFESEKLTTESANARDRLLASIRDPRLRAHLWRYMDRPWDEPGIETSGAGGPDLPGTTCVVAWDLAYYGDVRLVVMQTERAPSAE
jgi:hypothetical protein